MEIGKKYKIVYQDNKYTKIVSGKLLNVDDIFVEIDDIREGHVWIGKSSIVKIMELGERDDIEKR